MNNVSRNDFLFFQNEVFQDMKTLEMKINEKMKIILNEMNSYKESSETNYHNFSEKLSQMMKIVENTDEKANINTQISSFQKQIDEISFINKKRITIIEKEINDIKYKYDKIFLDNMTVPGIVGNSCTFKTIASFIDYSNTKIKELLFDKTRQNSDMKGYKEKLEILIESFSKQIKNIQGKFGEYCSNSFKDYEKNCKDRYGLLQEKVESIRMENGKYSYDLIKKANDINIDWEKIQKMKEEIYQKFNEELNKHALASNNLCKVFNTQREEFKIIKDRFNELSEFIKDVRFRTNINNNQSESEFENKLKFKNISKKINFKLKQKLETIEDKEIPEEEYTNKDSDDIIEIKENNNIDQLKNNLIEKNDIINNTNINNININNKQKKKNNPLINKTLEVNKVNSTIKDYFNQNKEFKSIKLKNKNVQNFLNNNISNNKNIEEKNNINIKNNIKDNEYFSDEEEKIKSLNDNNKKNQNQNIFLKIKKSESNKNFKIDKLNLNINLNNENNNVKPLKLIKESSSIFTINKTRNNNQIKNELKNINLTNYNNAKNNIKKSLYSEFNKNIKVENVDNNIYNNNKFNKDNSNKGSKIDLPEINETKDIMASSNNQNEIRNTTPILSMSQLEKIINNAINKRNNKNNLNTKSFSFITNPDIKQKLNLKNNNNTDSPYDIKEISLNFMSLNEKIININKRINQMYKILDKKINKIYNYLEKLIDELKGKLFLKENNKYNLFNIDLIPKTILTATDITIPLSEEQKNMILSRENSEHEKEKKFYSPQSLKKVDSFKSLVDEIEPYLIKKFQE